MGYYSDVLRHIPSLVAQYLLSYVWKEISMSRIFYRLLFKLAVRAGYRVVRRIDSKYHAEGIFECDLIKTTNGMIVPTDEPTFLFRGRDYLAAPALRHYATICGADSATDWQMSGLKKTIEEFETFARNNPQRMKQPGVTRGL